MEQNKKNSKYKTIGQVAKILNLVDKKKAHSLHIPYVFGKRNLNKLNQKFLQVKEDITMRNQLIF